MAAHGTPRVEGWQVGLTHGDKLYVLTLKSSDAAFAKNRPGLESELSSLRWA